MPRDPLIEKLLILQDRDIRRDEVRKRLDDIPSEIAQFTAKIATEKQAIEQGREALRQLELRRRDLETQVSQMEEQCNRLRTQQLSVKKNEEYTALEKEIGNSSQRISDLESEALELMIEIDEKKAEVIAEEEQRKQQISEYEGHIARLGEIEQHFKQELQGAEKAVADAEEGIHPRHLSTYRYVKERVRRPPYVTTIEEQKCTGCHLRVSYEIIKGAGAVGELTRCESCGRIVFM